jgi:PLP dependent protein
VGWAIAPPRPVGRDKSGPYAPPGGEGKYPLLREIRGMDEVQASVEESLAANIARVRAGIGEAARKVGRSAGEITLVAVSKTVPVELVEIAYNLGVSDFGENRVQDALPKIAEFHPRGMRWHMIGHLQSNKAGKVASAFDAVQSVDSLRLAQALNRHAEEEGKVLPVLLQVNVAGEESKEGMTVDETASVARQIVALPCLKVHGLMTIAPLVEDAEEIRYVFRSLRALQMRLRQDVAEGTWDDLSMGMTDDYGVAIEEGATIVRIGRAIFGKRVR